MTNPILVEVLTASGCKHCVQAQALVRSVVDEFQDDQVHYRAVNVVDEIDYAVQLGVLSTPAVAIDGNLAFAALPASKKLHAAINAHLQASKENQ